MTQPPLTQYKVRNLSDASHVNDVVMTNQQTSVPDTIHNASDQEQEVERPKDGQNPLQENHEEAESDCPAHDEDYSTFLAFSGTYSK